MNSLYIIGNGFDLAHGIDTHYWSFRTFLEENYWGFLQRFENLYGIQPLDESEYGYSEETQERWNTRVNKALWSEFERFMATPDIQSMLDYSSSVVGDLDLDCGNYGIRGTMDDYWRREFGFIKNLQEYVKEWIEQIDISGVTPKKQTLVDNGSDYFFNIVSPMCMDTMKLAKLKKRFTTPRALIRSSLSLMQSDTLWMFLYISLWESLYGSSSGAIH